MIGESPQSAKVYTVGAAVRPGTKLHSVYLDRVILDRNGQLETLSLPKPSTAGIAITRTAAAPRPGGGQFADNLRRIAETNPTAFAEVVRPQPVFANGVQRGYRVYPGRNRQQFAKLGLQPGDLVLSINGTPLDDPQRGMEIFNTIGTSDRVTRDGRAQRPVAGAHAQHGADHAAGCELAAAGQQPASSGRSRRPLHARAGITHRPPRRERKDRP